MKRTLGVISLAVATLAVAGTAGATRHAGTFTYCTDPTFPPIAIVHGTYDPVIPVQFAHQARELLEEAGVDPLYRELPVEHWIDPSVLPELRQVVSAVHSV